VSFVDHWRTPPDHPHAAMGILASRIWQRLFGHEEFKVCICGLDNAGKTTILYQILLKDVVVTSPTIGSNVEEVVYNNVHFVMWDIGGQESLRSSWHTYYTNTKTMMLVIDSSDHERLPLIKTELYQMLSHEDLKNTTILVLANKQDVKGAMTAGEISEKLNLPSLKQHAWHIQPCCALTGEGLYSGLDWMISASP